MPQLLRNAAAVGLDLQPAIDRGVVRLYYDPPQEIEVDRHFHKIEAIVEDLDVKRELFRPGRRHIDARAQQRDAGRNHLAVGAVIFLEGY